MERQQVEQRLRQEAVHVGEFQYPDKKADHDTITIVQVDEIGKGYLQKIETAGLWRKLK